jgi:hypothetical protein
MKTTLILLFLATVAGCFGGPVVISFDTTPLAPGTYFLDFQLVGADDALGNSNNTVTVGGLQIAGGSFAGAPLLDGGATGSAESGFEIIDSDFSGFNAVLQTFTAGGLLRFLLNYTQNYTSGFPDQFTFAILDFDEQSIVTGGNGALLTIPLMPGSTPALLAASLDFGGGSVTIDPIPEPSTFTLVAPFAALALWRVRRA